MTGYPWKTGDTLLAEDLNAAIASAGAGGGGGGGTGGSDALPFMDGVAAAGAGTAWSRGDHIHPTDTSRYAASNPLGYQTAGQVSSAISASAFILPIASTSLLGGVKVDGSTVTINGSGVISAAVSGGGIPDAPSNGNIYGRMNATWVTVPTGGAGIADAPNDTTLYGRKSLGWAHLTHNDITDWTATLNNYAPLASPVFTGTPSLPTGAFGVTQAPGTSNTTLATTAFVGAAAGSFLPIAGGTITGNLTIGTGAGTPTLFLNGAAGTAKGMYFRNAGITRYQMTMASDNGLGLYVFDALGGYVGEGWYVDPAAKVLRTEFKLWSNVSVVAGPNEPSMGLLVSVRNTGTRSGSAALVQYTSDSTGNFDTALNVNATFSNSVGGSFETLYFNCESPNTTVDSIWGGNVGEINFINRGPDSGFKRSRDLAGNNSGGLLFVPECVAPSGVGEGKNVGYGFSVAHSGGSNSTGFPAKTYVCFNAEPNATVGLTGRAFYASGDITNTASQRPYGPFQLEGTFLHGFDHTLATYMDNHAVILKSNMDIAWIAGTTGTPTAVASISAAMLGANGNVTINSAGATGKIILKTPNVFLGDGTGTSQLQINGAPGTENGIDWVQGATKRWELATDAGNSLWLYKFDAAGAFVGPQIGFDVTSGVFISANVGFNGTAPIAKPTVSGAKGSNAALTSLILALKNYGLITDTTTA